MTVFELAALRLAEADPRQFCPWQTRGEPVVWQLLQRKILKCSLQTWVPFEASDFSGKGFSPPAKERSVCYWNELSVEEFMS